LEDQLILKLLDDPLQSNLKLEEFTLNNSNHVILRDISTSKVRPIIPEKLKKLVFDKIHGTAHPKVKATHNLIHKRFVWQNIKRDIQMWVRCCVYKNKNS